MKPRLLWGFLLLSLIAAPTLLVLRSRRTALPVYGQVPAFTLTDQEGQPFAAAHLLNNVWIADFIFTSCAGACPEMTSRMVDLQKHLPSAIQLASVSVDPARDTPDALRRYAQHYGADPARWHFLTGPEPVLRPLIQNGFHLSLLEGSSPEEPIAHSQQFVLVDRKGQIRRYYNSTDPAELKQLIRDARSL